jgi:hypothetical protein
MATLFALAFFAFAENDNNSPGEDIFQYCRYTSKQILFLFDCVFHHATVCHHFYLYSVCGAGTELFRIIFLAGD